MKEGEILKNTTILKFSEIKGDNASIIHAQNSTKRRRDVQRIKRTPEIKNMITEI